MNYVMMYNIFLGSLRQVFKYLALSIRFIISSTHVSPMLYHDS